MWNKNYVKVGLILWIIICLNGLVLMFDYVLRVIIGRCKVVSFKGVCCN